MEIVYFTCHAQSVFLCFNCLMRTRILQLMLVQFHMENKEQLRQKMRNKSLQLVCQKNNNNEKL
ncbi:hypothetical protein T06_14512 [Trichinella sp. T6]|nr:hypothetical protein T06_14512 [Trichinella sp. T6]